MHYVYVSLAVPWLLNNPGVCLVFCLQALLEQVVMKSKGYSVDQLERLYSVLSQCIYQYRRDYDKTCLIEVSRCFYFQHCDII